MTPRGELLGFHPFVVEVDARRLDYADWTLEGCPGVVMQKVTAHWSPARISSFGVVRIVPGLLLLVGGGVLPRRTRRAGFAGTAVVSLVALGAGLCCSAAASAESDAEGVDVVVTEDGDIYGSQATANLIEQARRFDPKYCPAGQADRDRAVGYYEQAIDSQPGAEINAPLANRIAQLYALHRDSQRKVAPDRDKARQWWNRCLEFSNPRQLIWAEAQMGLASVGAIAADSESATTAYDKILELDVDRMELAAWKAWPDEEDSEQARAFLEYERERLRQEVEGIQARAAEKKSYVEELAAKRRRHTPLGRGMNPKRGPHWYLTRLVIAGLVMLVIAFLVRRIVLARRQNHP